MNRLLLIIPFLTGCTMDAATGSRRLLGMIPVGVSKNFEPVKQTWMQVMTDQMAGWQWTAIALIIVGVVIAKLQIFPRTGLGVTLAVLGLGFSAWGLAAPKLVGMLTLIVIVFLVAGIGYVTFCLATGRKIKRSV